LGRNRRQIRNRKLNTERGPSVTIIFDETISFDHLHVTESLEAESLAALAFEGSDDRDEFVKKIHQKFNDVYPQFERLVEVSSLSPPEG